MRRSTLSRLSILGVAGSLAGCATTAPLPPTQVVRYHLGEPIARGTVAVEPLAGGAPASIEFKSYAAAVQGELLRSGYVSPAPGATADFVATVDFRRSTAEGPPRRSPISIGLGGGGFSGGGGYRGGGGVGLGGGVSFPVGGGRGHQVVMTELKVAIARRTGSSPGAVWEGTARAVTDLRAPDATADGQAHKLAGALFAGFPGESGRTIEVK